MNDFTILLPIRGTEREKSFVERSVNSAIDLNPGEIIFALDDPSDEDIGVKITTICMEREFKDYKILELKRNEKWNFQLAYITVECYKTAKYDKILHFDIDSILRKEVMIGYDIVGKDNVAICSFTKKLLVRNLTELIRHTFYRLRVRKDTFVFSGVYWVFRPYYFKNIKEEEFMKIRNGIDTYMIDVILANKTHKIITRKEMGCNCLDIQNNDYPWRQFQDGVWWYSHREELFNVEQHKNNIKNIFKFKFTRSNIFKSKRKRIIKLLLLIQSFFSYPIYLVFWLFGDIYLGVLFIYRLKYGYPYVIKGYKWARQNPEHEVVTKAKKLSLNEWGYIGGDMVKLTGIKFDRSDGTGF